MNESSTDISEKIGVSKWHEARLILDNNTLGTICINGFQNGQDIDRALNELDLINEKCDKAIQRYSNLRNAELGVSIDHSDSNALALESYLALTPPNQLLDADNLEKYEKIIANIDNRTLSNEFEISRIASIAIEKELKVYKKALGDKKGRPTKLHKYQSLDNLFNYYNEGYRSLIQRQIDIHEGKVEPTETSQSQPESVSENSQLTTLAKILRGPLDDDTIEGEFTEETNGNSYNKQEGEDNANNQRTFHPDVDDGIYRSYANSYLKIFQDGVELIDLTFENDWERHAASLAYEYHLNTQGEQVPGQPEPNHEENMLHEIATEAYLNMFRENGVRPEDVERIAQMEPWIQDAFRTAQVQYIEELNNQSADNQNEPARTLHDDVDDRVYEAYRDSYRQRIEGGANVSEMTFENNWQRLAAIDAFEEYQESIQDQDGHTENTERPEDHPMYTFAYDTYLNELRDGANGREILNEFNSNNVSEYQLHAFRSAYTAFQAEEAANQPAPEEEPEPELFKDPEMLVKELRDKYPPKEYSGRNDRLKRLFHQIGDDDYEGENGDMQGLISDGHIDVEEINDNYTISASSRRAYESFIATHNDLFENGKYDPPTPFRVLIFEAAQELTKDVGPLTSKEMVDFYIGIHIENIIPTTEDQWWAQLRMNTPIEYARSAERDVQIDGNFQAKVNYADQAANQICLQTKELFKAYGASLFNESMSAQGWTKESYTKAYDYMHPDVLNALLKLARYPDYMRSYITNKGSNIPDYYTTNAEDTATQRKAEIIQGIENRLITKREPVQISHENGTGLFNAFAWGFNQIIKRLSQREYQVDSHLYDFGQMFAQGLKQNPAIPIP